MVNQCKDCKSGHTLRIHVLTGHRNCEKGRHAPSGVGTGKCKDYKAKPKAKTGKR
jgi:hypothetical protein